MLAGEKQYYTLKSGDSPWKIAKQFEIDVSTLMELNELDEETARKLKIGDRVRVNMKSYLAIAATLVFAIGISDDFQHHFRRDTGS